MEVFAMVAMKETEEFGRKTGIDVLGNVPWGTHLCLFYKTKKDLIEVLVPYFKAGLEHNEFCMWITCEPLNEREAEKAMRKAVPDFDEYLSTGQIEILPHSKWYLKAGSFDAQRVLKGWIDKLNQALTKGYAGLRATGNMMWLEEGRWRSFVHYEHEVNEKIGRHRMVALCTYCLDKCGPSEIIDVVNNHQLALIKQDGKWTLTKNAERMRREQRLLGYQARLKSLVSELSLIEEREKRRIATELHERIGQSLVISKMNLEELRQSVPGEKLNAVLDKICNTLGETIAETQSLTFDLSSPVLYELGFETAVADWLEEEIQEKHGIATQFEDDKQPKPLDDDISILLFRFVRELLVNVVNHAQAKKIKVSIRKVGRQIQVSVEDDGVGFDPAEVASTAAKRAEFGLFGIHEKLEYLGGHLEIKSEPGRGCKATMTAPLKQQ